MHIIKMCIRDRFIDARKMGTMVSRKLRELTDDDIKKISDTYEAFVDGTLEEDVYKRQAR